MRRVVEEAVKELEGLVKDLARLSDLSASRDPVVECYEEFQGLIERAVRRASGALELTRRLEPYNAGWWLVSRDLGVLVEHLHLIGSFVRVLRSEVEARRISRSRLIAEHSYVARHVSQAKKIAERALSTAFSQAYLAP